MVYQKAVESVGFITVVCILVRLKMGKLMVEEFNASDGLPMMENLKIARQTVEVFLITLMVYTHWRI